MDTARWPQESAEKEARPQKEQALNCPRCNSTNTKFCYYNNYSLTQPRYFCKTCRRYWTEGGSLKNIPAGGGSRKNKRSSSSSSSSSSSASFQKLPDLLPPVVSSAQNPKTHEGQDLNLSFPTPQDFGTALVPDFMPIPIPSSTTTSFHLLSSSNSHIASTSSTSSHLSALELPTGIASRGFNSFMPMPIPDPNTVYTRGFPMQDFKPSLNFSLDGIGTGYGSSNGRLLFPFEDLKQVPTTADHTEQNREQGESTGFWTGMLGGGSWKNKRPSSSSSSSSASSKKLPVLVPPPISSAQNPNVHEGQDLSIPIPQDFRTAVPLPEKPAPPVVFVPAMEKPASTVESDEKVPQSDSFKEESTSVSDLSEMEKKALEELKQLVLD